MSQGETWPLISSQGMSKGPPGSRAARVGGGIRDVRLGQGGPEEAIATVRVRGDEDQLGLERRDW